MKHAILVMAHGDMTILSKCMKVLDDSRFDFYIHVDSKSNVNTNNLTEICNYSKVYLTERIPVYWGDYSQVEAQIKLIEAANNEKCQYDYYHMISGADMPLKTPDEIDCFFELHKGKEFIRFWGNNIPDPAAYWRVSYVYPFISMITRGKSNILNTVQKEVFARLLRYKRRKKDNIVNNPNYKVVSGDCWWSLTNRCIEYIESNVDEIERYFSNGCCVDEVFMSTMIASSEEFLKRHSNFLTREIDWERGRPYVWEMEDYDILNKSNALFARKFSSDRMEIVDKLERNLLERKATK